MDITHSWGHQGSEPTHWSIRHKLVVPIVTYARVLAMRGFKMGTAAKAFLSRELSRKRAFIDGIRVASLYEGQNELLVINLFSMNILCL